MSAMSVDVAVVGAGSAGAAVALGCARRGLTVVVLEQRPLDVAGARWVNAVPRWTFERAGIVPPAGDELIGSVGTVHLFAGDGRVTVPTSGLLEVDMRRLIARLQAEAQRAGAIFYPDFRASHWDGHQLHAEGGRRLAARWLVDASGVRGTRTWREQRPSLEQRPSPGPGVLCSAAQQVRRVEDVEAAARYFSRLGVPAGEAYSRIGLAGGYSTLGMRWQDDRIGILTGSVPARGYPTGLELLERFVARHRWIGECLFGGAGTIPLGRPIDQPGAGSVAAVGDAAGQVFTAHGSGVGQGLLAASLLAKALASGGGPAAYAVSYQRRYGGTLAAFDAFRRLSEELSTSELTELIHSGLLSADTAWFGLSQADQLPGTGTLARACGGAVSSPVLGARVAGVVARMVALLALYRTYPRRPAAVRRWARRVDRLLRD